jgi:hypothetical protein
MRMELRETVALTLQNMTRIFEDVSAVMQVVEQKVKNRHLIPLGYSDVTWEVSRALESPKEWLYRWFARAYVRDSQPKRVVGFCIHLGHYEPALTNEARFVLPFPFVNVARVELNVEALKCSRPSILNALWTAGWHRDFLMEALPAKKLVRGKFEAALLPALEATAYFVDLLELTSTDTLEQAIAEPLVRLFDNDDEWIAEKSKGIISLEAQV